MKIYILGLLSRKNLVNKSTNLLKKLINNSNKFNQRKIAKKKGNIDKTKITKI